VHQLENKVLVIVDARCNHDVWTKIGLGRSALSS